MRKRHLDAGKRKTALRRVLGMSALTLAMMFGLAAPASAQPVCASHADLSELLAKRYAEQPTAIGIASNGHLLEVFTANDGSTWTIVMTSPQGQSCVVSDGQSWGVRQQVVALGPQA